ncbi:BLUF domain-containing protein [Stappia indica]|uniref:BLUF domain-containing protein n=1 Tax=Stappia indica TaxID=538381 RepID=UPI0008346C2A
MVLSAICYRARIDGSSLDGLPCADVDRLLDRTRRLNRLNGVTGILLRQGDHVLLWLEGEASGLADSCSCAEGDLRLSQVEVLSEGPLDARLFPHCWLCLANNRDDRMEIPVKVAEVLTVSAPAELTAVRDAVQCLARRIEDCRYTRAALLV